MSNQGFDRGSPGAGGSSRRRDGGKVAPKGYSDASNAAEGVADKAREVASNTASTISHHVKELLDDQVVNGARMVGHLANSAKRAAEDLDPNAPQFAGLLRGVADRLEGYSHDLEDQSVDELVSAASNFTRRQPAVVFGLAALVGFFVLRTFKSTPSAPALSRQARQDSYPREGEFHGS